MDWSPLFSPRDSSPAKIKLPSQPPLVPCVLSQATIRQHSNSGAKNVCDLPPQSWKTSRMAARASGLHSPPVRNLAVKFFEMSFQTAGQLLPPSLRAIRFEMAEKSGYDIVGNEKAEAVEARRRVFVRCILAVEGRPE